MTEILQSTFPAGFSINLGNAWKLVNQPRTYTDQLRQRFGKLVSFTNAGGRAFYTGINGKVLVIALTSEGAKEIMQGDPNGYDPFWKEGFSGVAGNGSIWVLGGNKHRRERQMLTPAFHAHSFDEYGEVIRQITRQQTQKWQPGQTFGALDTTLAISLNVILRLVFGVEDEKFFAQGHNILYDLWHRLSPLFVFFPKLQRRWFPPWVRYCRAKDNFSNWVKSYVAERRAQGSEQHDILGRMLAAHYEDGSPMQDADIQDELITILLAGHETTATALSWALYELGKNPAELEKLRAELDPLGPSPDIKKIEKLPYLTAVCNETLRLHTLLPEVARVLVSPLDLLGYRIPAGESVAVSIMCIHHDPSLYPEPDRFIPDRFIGRTYSPYEFLPFGGGHRRCLGASLSDYEMRIVLAEIVTHWEFEPAATEREIRHDIAMGPKNGVPLRIKARRKPNRN